MKNIIANLVFGLFIPLSIICQPSGGPYGPVNKNYNIPQGAKNVFYVSPEGLKINHGNSIDKPTSIEAAFEKALSGDVIILRGGVYRTWNLVTNQGITLQPYLNEKPILKGSFIAEKWTDIGNGLWKTQWTNLFPDKPQSWWRRDREGKKTPIHKFNNDMVFIDGTYLQSKGWEGDVDENSFFIDYESGTVYIGTNPTDKVVEITAFDIAILRTTSDINGIKSDKKGYTLRGIAFTQYAYRAIEIQGTDPEGISPEENHGKEVVGTIIEDCSISYCSRVAGYLRGDKMTVRNCLISDTSTEGLFILSSNDVLLEKNIIRRNNIEQITGYYPAAVKIFNQCYRVTCNDNLVIDHPYSNGIWYDVGNVDGVFTNNWIEGIGNNKIEMNIDQPWPSDNGFFFEISKGALCVGNVFVDCDHGIWALNSSDVLIYNNTFVNSTVCIGRNERSAQGDHFGWHPATGPDVNERDGHVFVNNLLTGDESFDRPLLYVWQRPIICDVVTNSQLKEFDNNVYVRGKADNTSPLIWWGPVKNENCSAAFNNLNEIRKMFPEFSSHSRLFDNYSSPLFKSKQLRNYQCLPEFEGKDLGKDIPDEIKSLSKYSNNGKSVGAYSNWE